MAVLAGAAFLFTVGPLLVDDGYYYLEIALNVGRGLGCSFDGMNPTNGFQPAWQALLVPVGLGLRDGMALPYVVSLIQLCLFAAGGWLLFAACRSVSGSRGTALAVCAAWSLNLWLVTKGGMSGMETGLVIFVLGLVMVRAVGFFRDGSGSGSLGLLLAVLVASRLDTIALAVSMAVAGWLIRRRLADAARVLMPSILFLGIYMLVNRLLIGYPLPVSGYMKSEMGRMLIRRVLATGDPSLLSHLLSNLLDFLTLGGRLATAPVACLVVAVAVLVFIVARRSGRATRLILLSMTIYTVLVLLFYAAMYDSLLETYTYYWFAPLFGWMAVLPGAVVRTWPRGRPALSIGLPLLTLAFSFVYLLDLKNTYAFRVPLRERPEYLGAVYLNGLEGTVIVASWDAGFLGYFCEPAVVNLDGLVNSYDFAESLRRVGLEACLDSMGVTHIANVDFYREKREFIERELDGWRLVFEESLYVPSFTTRFTPSRRTLDYGSGGRRVFYVYARSAETHSAPLVSQACVPVPRDADRSPVETSLAW